MIWLKKIPITTRNAIIIGGCTILAALIGYYKYTSQEPVQKEEVSGVKLDKGARTEGVNIGTIKGGTVNINVFSDEKEEKEFTKELEALKKELAYKKVEGLETRFAAGKNAFRLGKKYFSSREFDKAIKKFKESLEYLPEDSWTKAYVYYNLANAYSERYMWVDAESTYKESIKIILDKKKETAPLWTNLIGYDYIGLSNVFRHTGNFQNALEYLQVALNVLQNARDRSTEATALNEIGLVYLSIGQYQKAQKYLHEAQHIMKGIGDKAGEGTTLNNIGSVYHRQGNYPEALKHYQEALGIHREVGDRPGEGTTLNNIGRVYDSLGKYPEALEYYQEALGIHREVGDRPGEGTTLNNIGAVYDRQGNYPEALKHYQEALGIHREVGDRPGEAVTLHNIATVLEKDGKVKEAVELLEKVVEIDKETQNPDLASDTAYLEALKKRLKE